MRMGNTMLLAGCAALLVVAGCSKNDSNRAADNTAGNTATTDTNASANAAGQTSATPDANAGDQKKLASELLDARVKAAVLEQLQADASDVSINVDNDGAVKLSGKVMNADDQKKAQQAVQGIPGVTKVSNDISVESPKDAKAPDPDKAQKIKDQLLEAKVKAGLLEKLGQAGLDIKVKADKGQVELSGNVNGTGRQEAVGVAQGVAGAENVRDKLDVKNDTTGPGRS